MQEKIFTDIGGMRSVLLETTDNEPLMKDKSTYLNIFLCEKSWACREGGPLAKTERLKKSL
jgi:hypothetical protein